MDENQELSAKAGRRDMRNEIALKIKELRTNKHLWRPGAPRADLSCRRNIVDKEIAHTHADTADLGQLIDLAHQAGITDLHTVKLKTTEEQVPFEDWTEPLLTLTVSSLCTDNQFWEQIEGLWNEYQKSIANSKGSERDYQTYLELKARFG